MKMTSTLLFAFATGLATVSCTQPQLPSVNSAPMANVDLNRYMGTWYEIARLPNRFENGLDNVTANYTLESSTEVIVKNQGYESNGKISSVQGRAFVKNPQEPGRLALSFVPPYFWFQAPYHILYVNKDYSLALVSGDGPKYLWLLARSPQISEAEKNDLLGIARARGYETSRLIWVSQDRASAEKAQ